MSGVSAHATMGQGLLPASRAEQYKMAENVLVAGGRAVLTQALQGRGLGLS